MGDKKEKLKKADKDKLKQTLKDNGLGDVVADQWVMGADAMTGEEAAIHMAEKLRNK